MKARLDARKAEGRRLFRHPDVRAQASSVPDHRVNRDITAVFLATEQVSGGPGANVFRLCWCAIGRLRFCESWSLPVQARVKWVYFEDIENFRVEYEDAADSCTER